VFQGAHPYHIDDKGRLKMPADFIHGLGPSFTMTRGHSGCLWVLPEPEWSAMATRLSGDSIFDQRALALQRYFIGSAVPLSLDGQGRLTIPTVLREFAGIQHDVMVVGTGPRVEVWARDRWDEYQSKFSDDLIEELARSAGL
jgi:transcriptional regulator MraZ